MPQYVPWSQTHRVCLHFYAKGPDHNRPLSTSALQLSLDTYRETSDSPHIMHVRASIHCRGHVVHSSTANTQPLTPGCHLDIEVSLYLIPATSIIQTPDPVLAVTIRSDETGSTNLIRRRRIIPRV
jgi:hypothetical protein